MSGCDPLRVHALHDGTLRGDSLVDAERHLAECADCALALAELRALDALAREEAEVPAGYFDALPARVTARATGRPRAVWSRPAAWAGALAAALLIALVTPRLLERPLATAERPLPPAAAPRTTPPATAEPRPPAPAAEAVAPLDAARPGRPSAPPPNPASAPAPAETAAPEALERSLPAAPLPPAAAPQRARAESMEGAEVAPRQDLSAIAGAAETEVRAADATTLQKSAAAPTDALARARAERDRRVREALRPGAPLLAQRRALEAAAAVMRAGGDAADHALLAARAEVYLARVSDPAERQRVHDLVKALAPR